MAVRRSDLVVFMVDARAGITPMDEQFAQWVRETGKPTWLVANKCEGRAGESGLLECYALGLGDPLPLSAEHNDGLGELYTRLLEFLETHVASELEKQSPDSRSILGQHPDQAALIDRYVKMGLAEEIDPNEPERLVEIDDDKPLQLAVVGRPNVGKSTLINRLVGEDRMLTGPEAGITRDAVSVDIKWQDRRLRIYDTAGLRPKSQNYREAGAVERERYARRDSLCPGCDFGAR